jgi:hypothetical protein
MATESDCQDRRGSVQPDQLNAIYAAMAAITPLFLLVSEKRGEYVKYALRYRGIVWDDGPDLARLSCREAGFVLEALHESARGGWRP